MDNFEVLANVSRRREKLADIQAKSAESYQLWLRKEKDAAEALENVIALALDSRSASLRQLTQATGFSNMKLKNMAERARKRARDNLAARVKSWERKRCSCGAYLISEAGMVHTTCANCGKEASNG